MTDLAKPTGAGSLPLNGERRPDDRGRTAEQEQHLAGVDRLLSAARGLASTIAATEELVQQRADILTRRASLLGPARDATGREPIISLAEAARRTGRHPEVLRRWCLEGRIQGVRIGRTWGITPETLATLLAHSGRSRPRFPTSSSA
jgi:hypothetical protein